MAEEKNRKEADRWLATARSDLETALVLAANQRYAHSCLHAQQSGEKALKALWYRLDGDPWGHSCRKLIDGLKELDARAYDSIKDLVAIAVELDRFYIPTRYPNGLPEMVPDEAYLDTDAQRALALARQVIDRVAALLS